MKYAIPVLCTLALLLSQGCSTTDDLQGEPSQIYQEAEEDIESEHFIVALEKLRDIKNRFPYSKYSARAQLRIADVYFLQESYGEAANAYESFADLHPNSPKLNYALYRHAESYFLDVPDILARDMASAQRSLDGFNRFLKKFPQDALAKDARKRVGEIRNLLGSKEHYIGNYYYKRDHYESAHGRFKKVMSKYPETEIAQSTQKKFSKSKTILKERMANPPVNKKGTVLFDIYRDGEKALEAR